MKTARFATVVGKFGKPEPHLVLTAPEKDRTLQAAIKANRVMTVLQPTVGTGADQGVVGFEPGPRRQFLIFPKPLRALTDQKIVGIKYDLLEAKPIPKSELVRPARPRKVASKPQKKKASPKAESFTNIVPFKSEPERRKEDKEPEDATLNELQKQVRHAMKLLEKGKAVAAYNLLKQAVES